MYEHIEIEYKILLNQDIFSKILFDYKDNITNEYTQTNHYFTHPLLQQKKYMLRIREKNNHYELTLKRPQHQFRLETNVPLTPEEKERFFNNLPISNEIIDILLQEHINPFELKNEFSLTTHRYDIELPEGTLSLDHSTYLGCEDYELEFEVHNEQTGYLAFLKIIEPYQLHYTQNCLSKMQRILARKKDISKN